MYRCFPIASAKVGLFLKLPNYLQKKNPIIFDRHIVFSCLFIDNQWYMFFLHFVRDMNFFLR
ncbi:hypothetical protein DW228_01360 [Bacteroides fragilis]|uniref:Uncharacterized protein n=1 Tax=Bacteroides fragilis TaxID=817 RepID=A0A396C9K9_BACFG|nr:hypothetical protein DW228_01360 [Bacteroides fragilis]